MSFPPAHQDYVFAENVLLEGLKSFPAESAEYVQILFQLAVLMHITDKIDKAIPLYEEVLRRDPEQPVALSSLATAYHATGNFRTALDLYGVAEEKDPDNVIMLANFALLLCDQLKEVDGFRDRGWAIAQKAENINAGNLDVQKARLACSS